MLRTAKKVVWLSDGGSGFWAIYSKYFEPLVTGILDFYHAAQNLWKAASACLDGKTEDALSWFMKARHWLRHKNPDPLLKDIRNAMEVKDLPDSARKAFQNLYDYLSTHRKHIDYAKFKKLGLPIGSGLVESACKWLVQQLFKRVGMRWSEEGFNHLAHMRLAWVNQNFEDLFDVSPNL